MYFSPSLHAELHLIHLFSSSFCNWKHDQQSVAASIAWRLRDDVTDLFQKGVLRQGITFGPLSLLRAWFLRKDKSPSQPPLGLGHTCASTSSVMRQWSGSISFGIDLLVFHLRDMQQAVLCTPKRSATSRHHSAWWTTSRPSSLSPHGSGGNFGSQVPIILSVLSCRYLYLDSPCMRIVRFLGKDSWLQECWPEYQPFPRISSCKSSKPTNHAACLCSSEITTHAPGTRRLQWLQWLQLQLSTDSWAMAFSTSPGRSPWKVLVRMRCWAGKPDRFQHRCYKLAATFTSQSRNGKHTMFSTNCCCKWRISCKPTKSCESTIIKQRSTWTTSALCLLLVSPPPSFARSKSSKANQCGICTRFPCRWSHRVISTPGTTTINRFSKDNHLDLQRTKVNRDIIQWYSVIYNSIK